MTKRLIGFFVNALRCPYCNHWPYPHGGATCAAQAPGGGTCGCDR
jgi:hypothetical protein